MNDLSTSADIGQLKSDMDERLRARVIPRVTAHVTVGEPFAVVHDLGTIPSMAAALPFSDARVWSEEADRRLWTATRVVLRCNVSAIPLSIVVIE
jgi:hypothetical protein